MQPGPSVGPVPIGRGLTDLERFSGLLVCETGKKSKFYNFRLDLVVLRQSIEGFVQSDDFGVAVLACKHLVSQFNAIQSSSMLLGSLLPGSIDKNSAHRFCSG